MERREREEHTCYSLTYTNIHHKQVLLKLIYFSQDRLMGKAVIGCRIAWVWDIFECLVAWVFDMNEWIIFSLITSWVFGIILLFLRFWVSLRRQSQFSREKRRLITRTVRQTWEFALRQQGISLRHHSSKLRKARNSSFIMVWSLYQKKQRFENPPEWGQQNGR